MHHVNGVHRWFVTVLAMLGCGAMAQSASNATVDDVQVCPYSANVLDPEFDSTSQRMVFVDQQGRLKIVSLNADGTSKSPGCVGTVIDTGATLGVPGYPRVNGPEWGRSRLGAEIYYTKLNAAQQPALARASYIDGAWQVQFLASGDSRGLPFASVDTADPQPRLQYVELVDSGSYQFRWREAYKAQSEALLPAIWVEGTGSAPRWVQGQRAITTKQLDANGVAQAIKYSIDSQTVEVLTSDSGQKDEVWMWPAPEFVDEPIFFTVVDNCCLRVYRQIGGVWTLINTINASDFSSKPFIFSPEPFVYKGHSYVSMQLSSQRYGPSEIWIAAIDPATPLVRQVSDPSTPSKVRTEPEFMSTNSAAYIYYTMLVGRDRVTLRRANTGL
jgi:hypothetical protein